MTHEAKDGPIFTHDCANCQYLGFFQGADLYYCKKTWEETFIARFSDEGADYCSGEPSAYSHKGHLTEARKRAQTAGFSDYNLKAALFYSSSQTEPELLEELREQLVKSPFVVMMSNLAIDFKVGVRQMEEFIQPRVDEYKAKDLGKDDETYRDWILSDIKNAWRWARHFSLKVPTEVVLANAMYAIPSNV